LRIRQQRYRSNLQVGSFDERGRQRFEIVDDCALVLLAYHGSIHVEHDREPAIAAQVPDLEAQRVRGVVCARVHEFCLHWFAVKAAERKRDEIEHGIAAIVSRRHAGTRQAVLHGRRHLLLDLSPDVCKCGCTINIGGQREKLDKKAWCLLVPLGRAICERRLEADTTTLRDTADQRHQKCGESDKQ
jgi:hypothetical protein